MQRMSSQLWGKLPQPELSEFAPVLRGGSRCFPLRGGSIAPAYPNAIAECRLVH
jgi:hypothetical protein